MKEKNLLPNKDFFSKNFLKETDCIEYQALASAKNLPAVLFHQAGKKNNASEINASGIETKVRYLWKVYFSARQWLPIFYYISSVLFFPACGQFPPLSSR